jgi:hypothetical protein
MDVVTRWFSVSIALGRPSLLLPFQQFPILFTVIKLLAIRRSAIHHGHRPAAAVALRHLINLFSNSVFVLINVRLFFDYLF